MIFGSTVFCYLPTFTSPFHRQLYLWTWESQPMVMLQQFIKVRWQSKFGMLQSLLKNKGLIRSMCASNDEECRALHGMDLKEDDHVHEWETLQVRCDFHRAAWRFYHLFFCFCFASIECFTDIRRSCNCDKGIRGRTICHCFFYVACYGKN